MRGHLSNPKRGYHHGDLRRALLAAALKLLDNEGIEGVTVRAVARGAGVAHSAPANHFKDRAALLGALAEQIFEDLTQQVDQAMSDAPQTPEAKLKSIAGALLNYALGYPHRYRLLWRRYGVEAVDSGIEKAGTRLLETLERLLLAAEPRGARSVALNSRIIACWSLVHGYASLRIEGTLVEGKDEVTGKSRLEAILDVLINGLKDYD